MGQTRIQMNNRYLVSAGLLCPVKAANIPAMHYPSRRFTKRNAGERIGARLRNMSSRCGRRSRPMPHQGKGLTLVLLILLLNAAPVAAAPATRRVPTGSHILSIEHPFAMSDAMWNELFSATTPGGKRLLAQQLSPLVLHAEWPTNTVSLQGYWHLRLGIYLLNVRGDGGVSSVEILRPQGHIQMDSATVKAFAKWRFRPNSVKEVRVPAYYSRSTKREDQ
jgi:TonB family protein